MLFVVVVVVVSKEWKETGSRILSGLKVGFQRFTGTAHCKYTTTFLNRSIYKFSLHHSQTLGM